jgi:hypothetical protein
MFQTKVVEKIKIYILCLGVLFFLNRAIYEILCKNIVELDLPQMTIWHKCIACRISKATNTHSEYVILVAVPLQKKWLQKRVLLLRYTYIACLVVTESVYTVQYGLNLTTILSNFLLFLGGGMVVVAQAISHKHLTKVARVRSQVSQFKICGENSVNGTGYIPSPAVVPCHYHSTMFNTHFHLHVPLNATNGQRLGTLKKYLSKI